MGQMGVLNVSILMNRKKFESLPAAAKAAINKHRGEPMSLAFGKMTDTRTANLVGAWSKDPNHSVVRLSAANAKTWNARLRPVVDAWLKRHPDGTKLLGALKAELAKIRAAK